MCGRCRACVIDHQPTLCTNRRRYTSEPADQYPFLTGGLSQYCYVYPTSGRVKVPDSLSDEIASASSCALRTVVQGFERLGALQSHESVVILGSGPLGLFALAMAVAAGPANIIVVGGPQAGWTWHGAGAPTTPSTSRTSPVVKTAPSSSRN